VQPVPEPSPASFPGAPTQVTPAAPSPTAAAAAPAPAKAEHRPSHVEDLPLPPFDSTTQWVLYGRVYDLITLLPVPDVRLSFTAVSEYGGGSFFGPPSDADGRFAAVLRRLPDGSSYEIRASRSGYVSPALYESDIPYAHLTLAERREIVHNAQDGDMTLPQLTDIAGEGSRRRDVFLAPSR
jgi:hypothetical protein